MHKRKHTGTIPIDDLDAFKERLYALADTYETCFVYDSCSTEVAYGQKEYELIAALGSVDQTSGDLDHLSDLEKFHLKHRDWIFGGLSYDLKNELEELTSDNPDPVNFPMMHFAVPEHVILVPKDGKTAQVHSIGTGDNLLRILSENSTAPFKGGWTSIPAFKNSLEQNRYLRTIETIREHIRAGDVYELNFCMQYAGSVDKDDRSMDLYRRLLKISPVPFAAYARFGHYEVISASPERYMKKTGERVISQPIKGTASRAADPASDLQNKRGLQFSLKERAENVMIVDLVRNDLARTCKAGSIQVDELFGVYAFPQVFQMISTVSGELKEGTSLTEPIRCSFPMGSMTGAPKIAAMKLIEKYEDFKRGWYAGSLGYFDPVGNFDLNVLIRSIFLDRKNGKIVYSVGGAITIDSEPKDEFQECLWKASAIRSLFDQISRSGN